MAEPKKTAVKKAAATSATGGKAKTTQAVAGTPAKKTEVRKTAARMISTAAAGERKMKAPAVKKESVPAAKKESAPAAVKKSPARKTVPPKAQAIPAPTPEERYRMVQTAAYFIAERNGFQGYPSDHWRQAELEIAAQLRA